MRRLPLVSLAACAVAICAPAAFASDLPAGGETFAANDTANAQPGDRLEPIIVTGRLFSSERDSIAPPVVLSGDLLDRNIRPQLGDMLAALPGVSASGFAPGASRPVLRGFDAARVRLLVNGVGSLDASTVSADHAVAIDTLSVERIEVLHGPEVLLYAGDPAGGAVNVIDRRIPRAVPENGFALDAAASYGSAADSTGLGAAVDVALAPRLAAHFDASWGRSDDLRVGGDVLSPELKRDVLAAAAALDAEGDTAGAEELTALGNARGRLADSATRSTTLGAGLAFIDAGGDIGISVERFRTTYGIPARPEAGAHEPVSIALRQTRFDARGGINFSSGVLQRLQFSGAYGTYQHEERHGGVAEATFRSRGIETRLEAVQAERGGWHGTTGLQFADRSLTIIGDERLMPDNTTQNLALFTQQHLRLGALHLEGAARYENVAVRARPNGDRRSYDLWSGVAGVAWDATDTLTFHANLQQGQRAPTAEELFIDGVHEASQSYQIGNAAFRVEKSTGVEGGLKFRSSNGVVLSVIGFLTDFDDFITAVPTGDIAEGVPVYAFLQAQARFRGVEAEGSAPIASWGERTLRVDAGIDYTHAQLVGIGPVPRIPPLRLRGGVELGSPVLTLRGDVEWNARQNRVATFDNRTAAFTLVGMSATWRPMGEDGPVTLTLAADNLLNVTGRRAASETRDFVPIAGRDVRISAAFHF